MEFPLQNLLDEKKSETWIEEHFHPGGLKCPQCGQKASEAYRFRVTKRSGLQVYRCRDCQSVYNLYSRTIFEKRHLTPIQAVLLVRGMVKGEPSRTLSHELEVHYGTVLSIRRALQSNAEAIQPDTPLYDLETESDELFQNAGEKRGGTL